ncbi:MAG: HAMP domain-containing histidine kinase [Myxococcales bacterium]|nr:HAMP domain-containing histidine kinase [Myxococcales bacterium]
MARHSVGFPLTLGFVLAILAVVLAVVYWVLVLGNVRPIAPSGLGTLGWVLLALGTTFFVLIIVGTGWLCAWLVSEMRLNQRQRAFLDAVTHEMKTPLASMRLYVETLMRHDPERERREQFLVRMGEDLERLDRTVDQVLAAARAEEPGRRLARGVVALREVLESCIAEIRDRHSLPGDAVALDGACNPIVRGDRGELAVVFRNLLENAVKYSDEPVEVKVSVSGPRDGRVSVDISDRGIGIPVGELRKIFQRFYRVGRDVQRTAAGLGLGLFIVRNLVRRQGGRVEARSEGSGAGSRFVVTLRAAHRARAVPGSESTEVSPTGVQLAGSLH